MAYRVDKADSILTILRYGYCIDKAYRLDRVQTSSSLSSGKGTVSTWPKGLTGYNSIFTILWYGYCVYKRLTGTETLDICLDKFDRVQEAGTVLYGVSMAWPYKACDWPSVG